jgi:hypothetical protein
MSCPLTAGYTIGCRDSQGGIQYVIALELQNIESVAVTNGNVTAITMEAGKQGWKIEQEQGTGNFLDNPIGNRENGTYRSEQSVTLVLNDRKTETRNLVNLLAKNALVFVVVENTKRISLAGLERGLMLADGAGGTGTTHEERNGYTLPFTGVEREQAPTVNENILAALLEPAGGE